MDQYWENKSLGAGLFCVLWVMSEKDENAYGLAGRLALARKARGISRQQAAVRLGFDRATIFGYESGRRQPSLDTLVEMAKYYQVSTDYLLGLNDNADSIDLSGLDQEEQNLIGALVDDMKIKNAKLTEIEK